MDTTKRNFEKGQVVRSVLHYRKRIKFSQLNTVEEVRSGFLRLKNLATGSVMEKVPFAEMILVSQAALDTLFEVSDKSSVLFA